MRAKILIDLGKLKTFYSGLGQFSYYFGKNLSEVHDSGMKWNFLMPGEYKNIFTGNCGYEQLSFKRRYLPSLCHKYDVWHAIHQDSSYLPGHNKTKYILTIHDLNFLREKSTFRINMYLENLQQKIDRASYITFISNFTASEVNKYLNVKNKPSLVIHNGVEIDTVKEVAKPTYLPSGKFLFALGMILEKKNFHVLIDFMQRMDNFNLVIAGDKSYSYGRKLERMIRKNNLSKKIIMPGIISQDDKIYLFRNCSAFLFPSLNEGFGLPVVEAMRFGKPVFLSRYASLPEIGGGLAYYWDSFDPDQMCQTFNEMAGKYEGNKIELSEKIKKYSQIYSWDKSIKAYTDIYRELLSETKSYPGIQKSIVVEPKTTDRPVRILHLSSEKGWRGGEQQIANLVNELNKLGFNNLIGCEKNSRFEELCKNKNWKYFSGKFSSLLNLDTAAKVASVCRKQNIDILHLHTSKSHTVGVLSTLFGHRTKLVLTRRVEYPIGTNFLSRWKYNHSRIERIITVSDKVRDVISPVLEKPSKCITVHSGIDISKFDSVFDKNRIKSMLNVLPDEILIGNTSALVEHKDYFTFINTCEWVINKGLKAKFVIIGEGPDEQRIRRFIKEKKLEKYIILTGFRNDISLLFPGLDIFLMTTLKEGLGTSILDAFAAKIPVITTCVGGIPEMVKDGETGLLAGPGDHVRLGENILRLTSDNELRKLLTTNAYQLLISEFTKETMAERVMNIYKEIIAS